MGVKPGYKQTEVGVIPEDWDVEPLGSVCDIDAGRDLVKSDYSRTESQSHPFPIYSNALTNKGLYGYSKSCQYEADRITVTARGDIGHAVHRNTRFSAIGRLLVLSAKRDCDIRFLTGFINHAVDFAVESTGVPQLTAPQIAKYAVALPPTREEQQAIAEALSDADALVESLEQLLAKKRQLKQGVMQELLTGRKRLSGFELRRTYKQTAVGVIPADWATKRLGDLFEITSSKRVFQSEWKNEGVPFYRARELAVLSDKGYVTNELFISKEMYSTYKAVYGVPKSGDMLVTGVGTLGKAYVVPAGLEFYFKDGNIIWFQISGQVCSEFLRQLYLTPLIAKQIADDSAGTTVGTYTISGAKKTTIPFPSLAEQEAIASILSAMDGEIAVLEAKLTKSRQLKQGMMQELLTGRIRLV